MPRTIPAGSGPAKPGIYGKRGPRKDGTQRKLKAERQMTPTATSPARPPATIFDASNARSTLAVRCGLAAAIAGVFAWSYWPTIIELRRVWLTNPDYSGGALVPLIALYIVWARRRSLAHTPIRTCWWGLGLLVFSQLMRHTAVLLSYGSIEQYSLVLAIAGTVLLVFGWPMTRRLMWVLVFLLLLVPFPRRVHALVSLPLQSFATTSAVFCLETLGYLVVRQGNVLVLGENVALFVAEACSGLRMLTAFIIVGVTIAFLVRRPLWQKAVLVLATIPVAVLANTLRVTGLSLVAKRFGTEVSDKFFHDYAGMMMMPFAIVVLLGMLRLLGRPAERAVAPAPARLDRGRPPAAAAPSWGRTGPIAALLVVLLVGGAGHRWAEHLLMAADAAPAPLAAPLATLPTSFGPWEGTEIPIEKRVLEIAGTDDHVFRRYRNRSTNEVADLYVAYAARPARLLGHRPQVCYPAHGWTPAGSHKETLHIEDGTELPFLIHRFTRGHPVQEDVVVLNYYILRGQYVTDWTEFWGPSWRLPNLARDPSFYVMQVQIAANRGYTLGADGTEAMLRTLATITAPELRKALPLLE